jgi:putative membrane protein insertion efficiency factor
MRRLLVGLVDFYRARVSPLLPPACRFEPSCSAYAREALLRHGALKGSLLALWRVLRCNPFGKGGLDPVPPRGRWRPARGP